MSEQIHTHGDILDSLIFTEASGSNTPMPESPSGIAYVVGSNPTDTSKTCKTFSLNKMLKDVGMACSAKNQRNWWYIGHKTKTMAYNNIKRDVGSCYTWYYCCMP